MEDGTSGLKLLNSIQATNYIQLTLSDKYLFTLTLVSLSPLCWSQTFTWFYSRLMKRSHIWSTVSTLFLWMTKNTVKASEAWKATLPVTQDPPKSWCECKSSLSHLTVNSNWSSWGRMSTTTKAWTAPAGTFVVFFIHAILYPLDWIRFRVTHRLYFTVGKDCDGFWWAEPKWRQNNSLRKRSFMGLFFNNAYKTECIWICCSIEPFSVLSVAITLTLANTGNEVS